MDKIPREILLWLRRCRCNVLVLFCQTQTWCFRTVLSPTYVMLTRMQARHGYAFRHLFLNKSTTCHNNKGHQHTSAKFAGSICKPKYAHDQYGTLIARLICMSFSDFCFCRPTIVKFTRQGLSVPGHRGRISTSAWRLHHGDFSGSLVSSEALDKCVV